MANITKHGDTYRIKVSCGYDVNGKQVIKSMTYKPDPAKSGTKRNYSGKRFFLKNLASKDKV